HCRFLPQEAGEACFELLVHREGAVEESGARAGGAEAAGGLERGLLHPGIILEAQVIVRADHEDPAALVIDLGSAVGGFDGAEVRVEARGLRDLVVLPVDALVEDVGHGECLLSWWLPGPGASWDGEWRATCTHRVRTGQRPRVLLQPENFH